MKLRFAFKTVPFLLAIPFWAVCSTSFVSAIWAANYTTIYFLNYETYMIKTSFSPLQLEINIIWKMKLSFFEEQNAVWLGFFTSVGESFCEKHNGAFFTINRRAIPKNDDFGLTPRTTHPTHFDTPYVSAFQRCYGKSKLVTLVTNCFKTGRLFQGLKSIYKRFLNKPVQLSWFDTSKLLHS